MSFYFTTEQIINKSKTVTRHLGWRNLYEGDIIQAVQKCQGLKCGEEINRICKIKIIDERWEPLSDIIQLPIYGKLECQREGFPNLSPQEFVDMFIKINHCDIKAIIHRIEFEYV